jgi:DNA-binding LacI/PurR family transcriptional regulator
MAADFRFDMPLSGFPAGRPKHEVLKEHFVRAMQVGDLTSGTALPTEQALAESAGVSRSTVRQAMSALERDGLVRRIQGKGTFVHEDASVRLRAGVDLFALVVPETRTGFYPSLLHGFEAATRERLHQAVVCSSGNQVDRQGSAVLQLIDKSVAGVAIVPTTQPPTPAYQIRQLQQHGIPVVLCHRSVSGVQAPVLVLPHEKIGYLAGRKIVEQGHRRIAFIASHDADSTHGYLAGLRSALEEHSIALAEDDVWWGSSPASPMVDESELVDHLRTLFSRPEVPTAIFTSFDSVAEVVYFKLTDVLGLRIPHDVSLVGVGGRWRESAMSRRLTSIVVDEAQTARRAVELLFEMKEGKRPITSCERFELSLDVSAGQTLAPPRGTARRIHPPIGDAVAAVAE